jgi:putative sterol carrier protein
MTDATTRFFEALTQRRHEPLLARVSGTARFDVTDDGDIEHWLIRISKGDIEVTQDAQPADCVIRADRDQLNDLVTGRVNALAELLRGSLIVEGDPELLALLQRLFAGRSDGELQEAGERSSS